MKKKETIQEFNRLNKEQLVNLLREKRTKLCQFGFELAGGKVKDVREIRETRRNIARLETIIKQKI